MPFTQDVSPAPHQEGGRDRYPLSSQQELWCAGAESGAFGPRFIVTKCLRISGYVDEVALQGALDDVVARHEMLRTVVVRDARPRYQEVRPPSPAPLTVRDLPAAPGEEREALAQQLLTEAEESSVPVEELPLLRAVLARFDDEDAVLSLVTHHTAADGWSLQLIHRDLAACYALRTGEDVAPLPPARPYRDYVRWQRDATAGPDAERNMAYWHGQLDGAPFFTLPTDRPVRQVHAEPYRASNLVLDAEVAADVAGLARTSRSSSFMVMLAAFSVLAHRIRGGFDPVINTIVHGRGKPEYRDTVGPFLNFLPLRTDLSGCATFLDVLRATRATCLDAYAHEVPVQLLEEAIPSLMAPMADPANCDFIFGFFESPSLDAEGPADDPYRIADRTVGVQKRETVSEQIPGGAAWNMGVASTGEIRGALQFNPEEFDESTAAGWVAEYRRIVVAATAAPEREWKAL
ncbi:condensation domain-containing protein [Actinacidiphila sp. DG2A-62]|uniref:condensation domain-containing protein n=1 Tax=Actinacidiphila sp. DG2A-62 TaxID=3108821 RepID=UPI002DBBEE3B|nr:condensation domain-containing protein [Actinacidiphila sp. DG2A-62]MEC3993090.1 condensation domain-containing protein [Actinacidiphila sp. DG2A-62]